MHNQRIVILLSAIAGIIGVFLPYMKTLFFSISLIETRDGTGYIIIVSFLNSLIISLLGDHKLPLKKGYLIGTIIPGIIPGILLLLLVLSRAGDDFSEFLTNFDIGFYNVVLASSAILVFGLTLKDNGIQVTAALVKNGKSFCTNCGKEYSAESTSEFCEECGNKL